MLEKKSSRINSFVTVKKYMCSLFNVKGTVLPLTEEKLELVGLEYCLNHKGCEVFSIGARHGYSVLDLVEAFERVNGVEIPYEIVGRRAGDIDVSYADTTKAETMLGWKAEKGIEDMCRDAWRWQRNQI